MASINEFVGRTRDKIEFVGLHYSSGNYTTSVFGVFSRWIKWTYLKGKVGATFGSYGWSGESITILTETMKNLAGMNGIELGLRIN